MSINHLQGSPSAVIAVANSSSNSLQTSSQEHPSEPGKITDIIISFLGRENIDGSPSAAIAVANASSNSLQSSSQEHPSEPGKITDIIISFLGRTENIILENVTSRGRDIHRRCIADRATLIEKLRFPVLPADLVFYSSNKYLDERSAGSFNVAAGLNRKEAIRRNNALAADELCKIANSRECSELFAQILSSRSLSPVTKLDSIKSHLRSEVRIHRVGFAQIEFADKLVAELENQFPGDVTLNILKTSINAIKALKMTQTEQANAINAAIIFRLNSKDYLKKALDSLVLSNTKLKKMLPHTNELSNEQVLKLDFNIESASSIISFVELSRKTLIAHLLDNTGKLTNLTTLDLDNNRLTALPESISGLRSLERNEFTEAENIIFENVTSRGRDIHRRCIADRATLIEKLRFPVLPADLVFYFSNKYLDERSAGSFNVAAGLNRKEAIRRNNVLAADELCKIANSRECSELFAQILSSRSLSPVTKLDSIKSRLRNEVRFHRVGFAQIEFADKLVADLDNQFPGDVTLNILKTSINAIKALKMTQTEQANAINAAIIFRLNSKDYLKKALDSLVLSNTKLKKMLPHTNELSNEQVLKLDFNIESASSIISFVELSRKTLIAHLLDNTGNINKSNNSRP